MLMIGSKSKFTLKGMEQYEEFCGFLENRLSIVCNPKNKFRVKCAVLEAVNNAIVHGKFPVYIEFKNTDSDEVVIKITDSGQGFFVNEMIQLINTKGIDQLLEERLFEESGRGLLIIFKTVNKVLFNEKGNEISLFIENIRDCEQAITQAI